MIYYQNFPETSGSLSSLPIRDNFSFLKTGLDVHSSSSANPHSTTLDQVCDADATTDQAITVTSSGSVLKSLRVQNDELVGGNLGVKGVVTLGSVNTCTLTQATGTQDLTLAGSSLIIDGYGLDAGYDSIIRGNLEVTSSGSVLKSLRVQNNELIGGTLEIKGNTQVDGTIQVLTSGSVLKSLRVQNNELIGGNLEVKGNILVDSSGSVLKSLRVQNNEQIGGNLKVEGTATIDGNLTCGMHIYFGTNYDADLSFNHVLGYVTLNKELRLSPGVNIYAFDALLAGELELNYNHDGIVCIWFNKTPSGQESLEWKDATLRFEFSDNLFVDGTIVNSTSGSVLKSLRVQNNELIGDNLEVKGNILVDSSGSVLKSLRVQNNLQVGGSLTANLILNDVEAYGDVYINYGTTYADAILYFGWGSVIPNGSGYQTLKLNKTTLGFEFSNNVYTPGNIIAAASGSVLKSLRIQNNEQIGGSLEVKGNILVDSSGSILKSLRVQNNLQVGGNIIGGKKTIILPIDAAILPDNSAGNMAATIERIKSSAGAPSPHFMQAWFNSTTDSFLYWDFRMPNDYGSGLTAKVQYKMQTATSGSIVLGVALMAVTPGDAQSVDADSMGTVNSATDTVPGTVKYLDEVSIILTNTDSLVAGDFVVIYLMRDADNVSDTAKGDVNVVAFSLEYNTS